MTANWADLNGDLLNLILSNLFGKDRLSFSLVCRPWNAVASISPYRYSPCLAYYYRRTHAWKFYQYNTFFSISFPELENAELRSCKYGWLLMSRYDDTLFFFDPSNKQKVDVPCKVGHTYPSLCFFNPPTSLECMVVGITTYRNGIGICTLKRGQDQWETMVYSITDENNDFRASLGAPVLHCGLIYLMSTSGDVAILDVKRRHLDFRFECLMLERPDDVVIKEQYLVKVKGEEALFGVFVFEDERKVRVFRLSSEMKWDSVDGIGDKVLYLSYISSFGYKAHTKSMENTIYFPKFHVDVAVFYSLSDNKYHSLDGDYSEGNAYGLKSVDLAAWIMPRPAHEDEVLTTLSLSRISTNMVTRNGDKKKLPTTTLALKAFNTTPLNPLDPLEFLDMKFFEIVASEIGLFNRDSLQKYADAMKRAREDKKNREMEDKINIEKGLPRAPAKGNGLCMDDYFWSQNSNYVYISFPVPPGTTEIDVTREIRTDGIKLGLKGHPPVLDGELCKPVNVHRSFWDVDHPDKIFYVYLRKQNTENDWWNYVVKGEPEIDIQKVKPLEYKW